MSTYQTAYDDPALGGAAIERDRSHELLGQVMGYVAVTIGFTALGAYLGRDLDGAVGLVLLLGSLLAVVGLNVAASNGRDQLATALLFVLGLLLGLGTAPVIADYASADPSALWQASGATAAFVAAAGAYGYATRRDRLRRSTPEDAVPIAAGIFLDVFNVFLFGLDLVGGRRD